MKEKPGKWFYKPGAIFFLLLSLLNCVPVYFAVSACDLSPDWCELSTLGGNLQPLFPYLALGVGLLLVLKEFHQQTAWERFKRNAWCWVLTSAMAAATLLSFWPAAQ